MGRIIRDSREKEQRIKYIAIVDTIKLKSSLSLAVQCKEQLQKVVSQALKSSNFLLLNFLRKKSNLTNINRTLEIIFLCPQGCWLEKFFDLAKDDLMKPLMNEKACCDRFLLFFNQAIHVLFSSSTLTIDPVSIHLERHSLINCILALEDPKHYAYLFSKMKKSKLALFDLNTQNTDTSIFVESFSLTAFSLNLIIPWPLALIISKKALEKYRIIFRFLFRLRWTVRSIRIAWLNIKSQKFISIYSTCQRMFISLKIILRYIVENVLIPYSYALNMMFEKTQSVDQLINNYQKVLNCMLKHAFLCRSRLVIYQSLDDLQEIVIEFSKKITSNCQLNIESVAFSFDIILKRFQALILIESNRDPRILNLVKMFDIHGDFDFFMGPIRGIA